VYVITTSLVLGNPDVVFVEINVVLHSSCLPLLVCVIKDWILMDFSVNISNRTRNKFNGYPGIL